MFTTKPTPILCRHVMPDGFPVNRRAKGTNRRSYRTRPLSMVMMPKTDKVAGGIWKDRDR